MERDVPAWQPFHPEEPGFPVSLSSRDEDAPARVLLLLATEKASRNGWAVEAAVSLVRRLASEDGRALLADMALEEPRLHEALGVSNDEGVSDVFLWGASFQRVAHAVGPGLLFAPAGTVVADPGAVAESPRWETVTDGFRQARATLVLYVPHSAPGLHRFLDMASDVVALATREEAAGLAFGEWRHRVAAVLGPAAIGAAAGIEAEPGVDPERGGPTGDGDGRDPRPEPDEPDPAWEREISRAVSAAESRRIRPVFWVILAAAVVVVAVLVVAWAGWMNVPYLTPLLAGPTEVAAPDEGVADAPGEAVPGGAEPAPAPAGGPPEAETSAAGETSEAGVGPGSGAPVQRFSLQLGAYPDAAEALEALSGLAARRPDVPFMLAPVEVEGQVFHRVLAGLAADPAGTRELRASLAETMGAEEVGRWLVREGGWAYQLDEASTLQAARERVRELASGGIQPYVLEVTTDAGPAYRVYVGAYAGEAEAAALGTMLEERGLGDVPLVPRIGRSPE